MDGFRFETLVGAFGRSDGQDESKAHGIADILLKHSVMDAEILIGMSGWQEGKNAAVAIANLLYWPERYPDMKFAAAACRLQAGDFLLQLGDREEARRHYEVVARSKERPLVAYRDLAKARLLALERSVPRN